jgi:hypothetical protein
MQTPFPLTPLTANTLLHEIDLATYLTWLAGGHDPTYLCQALTNELARQGQRVVHLWEDVARQKPAVVASRLAALRGESARVPGRLTQVRRLEKAAAMAFLDAHHLQAPLPGKVRYGLFLPKRYFRVLPAAHFPVQQERPPEGEAPNDDDLLMAVATFAQPRQLPHGRSAELLRFASRAGFTVVGGLDKLLTTYLRNHPAADLMTYADRDWSDGASYHRLGFGAISDTPPLRFWLHPTASIRHHDTTLPAGITPITAPAHGYVPIFNAGSRKFVRLCPEPSLLPSL